MVNAMRNKTIFAWLAGTITAWAAAGGCAPPVLPPSAPSPLLQQSLPAFKRHAIDGSSVDTQAAQGHIVVVKFFAKYCEPCKRTLPAVERLHQQRNDVVFIGVAEDERASDTQEVIQQYRLTFPVVHDAGNVLSGRYRVTEMPATFVADGRGKVQWVGGQDQNEGDLAAAIAAVGR
jgi:peroxiredoxin